MQRWIGVAVALVAASAGCDGASDTEDAGFDAGATMDAGVDETDAGEETDAGLARDADGCVIATVGEWSVFATDDVSITYQANIEPAIEGRRYQLHLLFNRYMTDYVGTFDLSAEPDDNFGSCARCVLGFDITQPDQGFFVESGTLTLGESPFTRILDASLSDVRLVEVTIEAVDFVPTSVPVEGGECVSIASASVTQTFPPDGWSCEVSEYRDGETCHCGCGAYDPDCRTACDPMEVGCDPFMPLPPLPQTGCDPGEICGTDGSCLTGCDTALRAPCGPGQLCGFGIDGDQCYTPMPGDRIDDAAIGENCEVGALFCGESGGFLDGMCDDLDAYLCRPVCDEPSDCTTPGDLCYTVFGATKGYCRPPPPSDG